MAGNAVIGALRVDLSLNSARFKRGMSDVQRRLQTARTQFRAVAGAAALAGAALSAGIGRGLREIDRQAKAARSIDGTTTALRALELAAGDAGLASEQVASLAQKMGREIARASQEAGPAADALAALGLNAADLLELDADARLAAIADAVKGLGLGSQETASLLRDLGVRQAEASLLFIQGGDAIRAARSEVEALGLALDENAVRQVERTNDAMSRMGLGFEALRNQLAVAVAPALEALANGFVASLREGGALRAVLDFLAERMSLVVSVMGSAVAVFGVRYVAAMAAARGATGLLSGSLIVLRGAIMATGIGALIVGLGLAVDWIGRLIRASGGWGDAWALLKNVAIEVLDRIKFGLEVVWHSAVAAANGLAAAFLDGFAAVAERAGKVLGGIVKIMSSLGGALGIVGIGLEVGGVNLSAAGDAVSGLVAAGGDGLAGGRRAAAAAASGRAAEAAAMANTPLASLEALRETMAGLGDEGEGAATAAEEAAAAIEGLGETADGGGGGGGGGAAGAVDGLAERVKSLADILREGLTAAAENAAKAFGDFVARGFKDFKAFGDAIKREFAQLLSSLVAAALRQRILIPLGLGAPGGAAAGGAGAAMGGAGGFLGSIGSGLFGASPALGTGLLGGVGSTLSATFGAGGGAGGLLSIGANAAAAGGGIAATIGAALPVVGLAVGAFALLGSLFGGRKRIISKADFAAIQGGLEATGQVMLDTGRAGQKAARNLKKLFGGIEEFQQQTGAYFQAYFSDAERQAMATENLREAFADLGLAMPQSLRQFRDLVEAQDLTTRGGRETYATLIGMAEAFAEVKGAAASAASALADLFGGNIFENAVQESLAAAALARGEELTFTQGAGGILRPAELAAIRSTATGAEADEVGLSQLAALTAVRDILAGFRRTGIPLGENLAEGGA